MRIWGLSKRSAVAAGLVIGTCGALALPAAPAVAKKATVPEWPVYGADAANSRTVSGGPAATQVPLLKQAWRVDFTDGDFTGTPVVSGGVVYVGSNGGKVRAIQAVAVAGHPAGSVLWTATTSDGA